MKPPRLAALSSPDASGPRLFEGFWVAQLLGLMLLVLSYVLHATNSGTMEFSDQVMDTMFAGPIWGTKLARNLLLFALAMAFLHALFAIACWLIGQLSARAWPSPTVSTRQHVALWSLAITIGLLANNASTFPESSLGKRYADVMSVSLAGLSLGRALLLAALAGAMATVAIAGIRWWKGGGRPTRGAYAATAAIGVACIAACVPWKMESPAQPAAQPNIIFIGLDSLRPDLLDRHLSKGVTPHLDAFLREGVTFTNAMTPLARTFPSMMAMLSGRHPHHTGAVMNLLPRDVIKEGDSLPRILARAGYRSVYATDEVRFSNIDTSYGFDQAISPPIGATEFLVSRIADTPLTNLLMRTPVIKWLFPPLYANRGAANFYDPDHFVARVANEVRVQQPLFMTIHLTLGHWPYTWADSPPMSRRPEARWPQYYLNSAQRADQQFADVLGVLERKGLLANAIVVAYSDHGESFEAPHESLVPDGDPLIEALRAKPTWGHGTTVFTAYQYEIVLGMRRFGGAQTWSPGSRISAPVSFEDITPTIVDALDTPTAAHFDGRSLLPLLEHREGASDAFQGRIRFTETEYQPKGLATQEGKVSASSLWQAFLVYRIDPVTDRIEVKRSRLGSLLADRQYAAIGQTQLLAAVPRAEGPGHSFLAVPLTGGEPRELPGEPSEQEPELRALWTALHAEFGDIIESRRNLAAARVADPARTIPNSVTK